MQMQFLKGLIKMSDTTLKIITTDPFYTCPENIQSDVISILSKIYPFQKIKLLNTDSVEFIDQGGNFESVSCNFCGRLLEIQDWKNLIDLAFETKFNKLNFVTKCCNKETSLNDINYNWPAGFARFVVSIHDAETELAEIEVTKLEELLKKDLRIIWARY